MSSQIKPPKLGPQLQPGEGGSTTVTVIERREDSDNEGWGSSVVSVGLALDFDPAIIVAGMRDAWLAHTRGSILTGKNVETGGAAKPLKKQAAEAPGRQSDHRLYKTGVLADGLHADPIARSGSSASVTIKPPRERTVIVAKERKRGNDIMTTDGAAGAAVMEGARLAVQAMLSGHKVIVKTGAVEADEVKS